MPSQYSIKRRLLCLAPPPFSHQNAHKRGWIRSWKKIIFFVVVAFFLSLFIEVSVKRKFPPMTGRLLKTLCIYIYYTMAVLIYRIHTNIIAHLDDDRAHTVFVSPSDSIVLGDSTLNRFSRVVTITAHGVPQVFIPATKLTCHHRRGWSQAVNRYVISSTVMDKVRWMVWCLIYSIY